MSLTHSLQGNFSPVTTETCRHNKGAEILDFYTSNFLEPYSSPEQTSLAFIRNLHRNCIHQDKEAKTSRADHLSCGLHLRFKALKNVSSLEEKENTPS